MQRISPRHYPALVGEIRTWREEQLISEELAEALEARYAGEGTSSRVAATATIAGAVLVGLGVLLFIAANWESMGTWLKVIFLLGAVAASHYFGWRLQYEPGRRPKLGASLILLGSIFFGGSIWLLAQIFNLDPSPALGLFLWGLGVAPLAIVTRSVPQGVLFALIGAFWLTAVEQSLLNFALAMAAMLGMAHFLRSRATLTVALVTGVVWFLQYGNAFAIALIAFGLAAFAGFLMFRERHHLMSVPYMYAGTLASLMGLFILTFKDTTFGHGKYEHLVILMLVAGGAQLAAGLRERRRLLDALIAAIILGGSYLWMQLEGVAQVAMGNALLLIAISVLIAAGLNKYREAPIINMALLFFVIEIIARYFDFFFTMIDRSVFFLVGGIILMVVGSLAERSRRKLLERIA